MTSLSQPTITLVEQNTNHNEQLMISNKNI